MNSEPLPGFNDVLVGNTTICEVAFLISDPPSIVPNIQADFSPRNIHRLLEFCALVEAVVLHDTLFTLPGILPSNMGNLELYKRLLDADILKEYPSSEFWKEVIIALIKSIANAEKGVNERQWLLENIEKNEDSPLKNLIYISSGDNDEELWEKYYPRDKSFDNSLLVEDGEISRLTQILQTHNLFGQNGAIRHMSSSTLVPFFSTDFQKVMEAQFSPYVVYYTGK